jgi:hypothetical protein
MCFISIIATLAILQKIVSSQTALITTAAGQIGATTQNRLIVPKYYNLGKMFFGC